MGRLPVSALGGLPPDLVAADATKDLLEIARVFEVFNVPLFLTYGALLGAYRDKDFIPHDDDIDLCITAKIDYKTRLEIGRRLLDIGYTPQPISFLVHGKYEASVPGYNGDEETGIIVCQKRIRTTLFFFREEQCPIHGRDMVCVPMYQGTRIISTPAHFFDKPETIKFKGKKFLAPGPIKEYLSFTYGADWKKPIKGKHALQWNEMHPGGNAQT